MKTLDRSHNTHLHRRYLLTCEQFEELRERSGGRCEICRIAGVDQLWGKLCIDHDDRYGLWAVRGLLCHRCNLRLGKDNADSAEAIAYLNSAWYLRQDLPLAAPDEPAMDAIVTEPRRKTWIRTEDGWLQIRRTKLDPKWPKPKPWRYLTHRFGGHNLLVREPGDADWHALAEHLPRRAASPSPEDRWADIAADAA